MSNKLLKATHEGKMKIGETELNCAVLEDGTRIISRNAIFRAFGRTKRGRAKNEVRVPNMPSFIDANNLQPFIDEELLGVLKQHDFVSLNGKADSGYSAIIIPKLCKVYLDAREEKILKTQQLPLARASEILLIALSKVGITALVDEATGYQYDREKEELQKILKAYISEELLTWEKRFPDEFYREIFRLNNWDFTVSQIKNGSRPSIIGKWTKKYIYSVLPNGVLESLMSLTPRNAKGRLKSKLHQHLTREDGVEHLNKQIISTVTLMNISDSWGQFEKFWNKKYGQQSINFGNEALVTPKVKVESNFDNKLKTALNYNPKDTN